MGPVAVSVKVRKPLGEVDGNVLRQQEVSETEKNLMNADKPPGQMKTTYSTNPLLDAMP